MKRTLIAGTALVLSALVAAPLLAQSPGPGAGRGGPGPGPRFERICENRDARIDGMLAYAKTRLNITEAQQNAWNEFEQSVKSSSGNFQGLCDELAGSQRPTTLPERLALMEKIGEAGVTELKAIRPAVEKMYGQLTPEQQKIADSLMRHGHRMGRR